MTTHNVRFCMEEGSAEIPTGGCFHALSTERLPSVGEEVQFSQSIVDLASEKLGCSIKSNVTYIVKRVVFRYQTFDIDGSSREFVRVYVTESQ